MEFKSEAVIDLSGKLAVVTAAGRGIGAAIAEAFGRAGADLVIADIDEDSARKVAETKQLIGRKALAVKADVASPILANGWVYHRANFGGERRDDRWLLINLSQTMREEILWQR